MYNFYFIIIVIMFMFLFLTGYLKKTGMWEKGNSRNVCSLMNCSVLGFPRQFL